MAKIKEKRKFIVLGYSCANGIKTVAEAVNNCVDYSYGPFTLADAKKKSRNNAHRR